MQAILIALAAGAFAAYAFWRQHAGRRPSRSTRIIVVRHSQGQSQEAETSSSCVDEGGRRAVKQALQPLPLLAGLAFCAAFYAMSATLVLTITHQHL